MIADLDTLMEDRGIAAVIVPLHEAMHAAFRWISRGAKVTRGYAIKPLREDPFLVCYPMERDEAAATGLETRSIHDFDYNSLFQREATLARGYAAFFSEVLNSIGVSGTIAFVGNLPVHLYIDVVKEMEASGWRIFRGGGDDLIQLARKRKDTLELDCIRSVGSRTEDVVDSLRALLRECRVSRGRVARNGKPVLIGDLKSLVTMEIARLGLIEDHETILSQGRDAAIPHSRGTASDEVRPSVPIVIDIFPRDRDSGYFFDFTRTFCLGDVPDDVTEIHGHVLRAFTLAARDMKAGARASESQRLVCDYFEKNGFSTTRSSPSTLEGYVHGLGHGVGLDVHERPSFGLSGANHDLIEIGDVLTIEPGLYFPDREIGVRIEDTFVIDGNGRALTLCRSDYGLTP
ncbi:MAG TPA: M24 family metallopeptidase [Thermoanaerobaculia bacterium]|nr:M24 family metallopeptidase [Thermoanaerobaculia bacterium]